MDLIFNKPLQPQALAAFLKEKYAAYNFFLLYPEVNEWDDVPQNSRIFQYHIHEDTPGDYKYGLSIFMAADDLLPFLENLAFTLSNYFDCKVVCDASRVVIDKSAFYYSLLFEEGKVFLVDDRYFEETGVFTKVAEMTYVLPLLPTETIR
jgi:hypothetical protein